MFLIVYIHFPTQNTLHIQKKKLMVAPGVKGEKFVTITIMSSVPEHSR
jgi:hypothetical protein